MAVILRQFHSIVRAESGATYTARACGAGTDHGLWQGWLEFEPADGGAVIRSGRETTQPNRRDAEYWATGLTPVYLEGALERALRGPIVRTETASSSPAFGEPEPDIHVKAVRTPATVHSILDPFSAMERGEVLLRQQLNALAPHHLINIIIEYQLSGDNPVRLEGMTQAALIETIIAGVRSALARTSE
ncbi:MAG TPA: hypothetical protein VH583_07315 [Vicinamibacterales bacterium]